MELPVPDKQTLKKESKSLKAFMVLLKAKLTRQQLCRSFNFRKLMALVFDPDGKDMGAKQ